MIIKRWQPSWQLIKRDRRLSVDFSATGRSHEHSINCNSKSFKVQYEKIFILLAVSFFSITIFSQDLKKFKLYKPEENAEQEITEADKASQSGR